MPACARGHGDGEHSDALTARPAPPLDGLSHLLAGVFRARYADAAGDPDVERDGGGGCEVSDQRDDHEVGHDWPASRDRAFILGLPRFLPGRWAWRTPGAGRLREVWSWAKRGHGP